MMCEYCFKFRASFIFDYGYDSREICYFCKEQLIGKEIEEETFEEL